MSASQIRNTGHSVFQRLLNCARARGEDFNLILTRYAVERFLYRLSISPHAADFVLKGASMFLVWKGQSFRVTKDMDLLGFGSAAPSRISGIFQEICQVPCKDDGMTFMPETVRAVPIREEQEYGGIRVTLEGRLHHARIPLQVDIGFGDIVTPAPEHIAFPTLLDGPAPQLRGYSPYAMVAEKFEAIVRLGIANSRMKDFYDVWLLSRLFNFDGRTLCEALRATFSRRGARLTGDLPTAFTEEFRRNPQKQTQWRAFINKARPEPVEDSLDATIADLVAFLMPVVEAISGDGLLDKTWVPGGPWS